MNHIDFSDVRITGGFWKKRQDLSRRITVGAVYDRFTDTGRFKALDCDWKEGDPFKPHVFWDSDVAKWLEGAIYTDRLHPNAALRRKIERTVDTFLANQTPEGYFNSHFQTQEQERRFTDMDKHELYCAGHWLEAAVAYYEATGDGRFLQAMSRFVDYIRERFVVRKDTGFDVPGHEEIELALLRAYSATGDRKYLELSLHFINERGLSPRGLQHAQGLHPERFWITAQYYQNHLPVREQTEAVGHAVRAVYLYTAMADAAAKTGDESLKAACEALFCDITEKKMFISGTIGSSAQGEAFTVPYDLCNPLAYSETCASIGLIYFAQKMLAMEADSRYSDVIERALYNAVLTSTSLDGKAFFYENPQETVPYLHTRDSGGSSVKWPKMVRQEVFNCSCCPPNIVRLIPSLGNYIASLDGETVYLHQYMNATVDLGDGRTLRIDTKYPESGRVTVTLTGGNALLKARVPGWCTDHGYETERGYTSLSLTDGEPAVLSFPMKVRFFEARPDAVFNCGRCAVQYGPVLYCAEQWDNGNNLRDLTLSSRCRWRKGVHPDLHVPTLTGRAFRRTFADGELYRERRCSERKVDVTLIPYYAFSNRGANEMLLWFTVR